MRVNGKVVVVTGGASGIGLALCRRFAAEGAARVVVADLSEVAAAEVAAEFGGLGRRCDVTRDADIRSLIDDIERDVGPISLFCSNAGVLLNDPDRRDPASSPDEAWTLSWQVHVMAHVYAARALAPRMVERGCGHFLQTISAAGLLTQLGSGPYSASKHAAVAFAESLAIAYRDRGVGVSILCPQGVATPMLAGAAGTPAVRDGLLTPEQVADCALEGLADKCFLILPHPNVAEYIRRKASDHDQWIAGMARLRTRTFE